MESKFVRFGRTPARGRIVTIALVAAAASALAIPAFAQAKAPTLKVMTRNLYLGADLTPAIVASDSNAFIDANGQIVRDVITNDFPKRAKGLAGEILSKKPDLVGLQEASLWRKHKPPSLEPVFSGVFSAKTVRYDYIKELLQQLNKGKKRYRLVRSQTEFDFEAPADVNGVPNDSGDSSGKNNDGEENDRLTMRDAILARVNDGVKITKTLAGHYNTLYTPLVANTVTVPVTRGWVAADVTFHKKQFRLVNTHFEAFDSQATGNPTNHNTTVNRGEIREAQANQLVGPHGPTKVNRPVILIGDLNSDDDTVQDGDQLAYNAITAAGFRERSTSNPLGCCLNTSILTPASNGSVSDFDHQVDHILTNKPRKVQLVSSSVTGRSPHNDIWDSDHAGLFSALRLR